MFCFVFCSLLIMPQTVSRMDPIPSPPSAKIPAGGALCERRRHTCVSLAHRYGASVPARQTGRQAARLGAEKSTCPRHSGGGPRGRLGQQAFGKRCCLPAPGPEGSGPQLSRTPDLGSDWTVPAPTSWCTRSTVIWPLFDLVLVRDVLLATAQRGRKCWCLCPR